MKVILISDVKNLGKINQIVDVADGYAKNYLLRNNLAIIANEHNLNELNKKIEDISNQQQLNDFQSNTIKNVIEAKIYEFELKINNNKCFGSVSNKDIIDKVNENETLITKSMFDKQYKLTIGNHKIVINLSKTIKATINIVIKGV